MAVRRLEDFSREGPARIVQFLLIGQINGHLDRRSHVVKLFIIIVLRRIYSLAGELLY
jgi:hypothetical protein